MLLTRSAQLQKTLLPVLACLICGGGRLAGQQVKMAPEGPSSTPQENPAALTLDDLEKMALAHNPTLAEAQAGVRVSEGRKVQSHLYPNPTVGYAGREINGNPIYRWGEHGFFIEQPIVTAGKLGLNRQVSAAEEDQAKSAAAIQRDRVINAVRIAYYRVLGAQQRVELKGELEDLAHGAAATAGQLANVGQADQPDVLQARVEAGRAHLELMAARTEQERAWQELVASVGDPSLPVAALAGKLDDGLPEIDRNQALAQTLNSSPEIQAATAAVTRAEAGLKRAQAAKFPDIELRGGLAYNRELLNVMGSPVGWEGEAQVGLQIPIFNRNQGNTQAADAELERARQELERVKLALRARFASLFRDYADAHDALHQYRDQMLPDAQKAYDLYLGKYRQMAAAYPQVLIAQRTLLQLRVEYTQALVREWESAIAIQGYLLTDGLAAPPAAGQSAITMPGISAVPETRVPVNAN
ncbi:MAG TPA: TolC family protein [Terriglobia bacterium]|nr:TolC family protein [Terriglobia bacterium]